MYGEYLEIYQDGKPMQLYYKRYKIDESSYFYSFSLPSSSWRVELTSFDS